MPPNYRDVISTPNVVTTPSPLAPTGGGMSSNAPGEGERLRARANAVVTETIKAVADQPLNQSLSEPKK